MPEPSKQKVQIIISYYQTQYSKLNDGKRAIVNRNKAANIVTNMLKDLSVAEVKELIDFYLKTDKSPSLVYLCYEYDEVLMEMKLHNKDLELRRSLIDKTEQSVIEFRRRYGDAHE